MPAFNSQSVNKAIRALGGAEKLVKGEGYFYFTGGEAASWPATSVYVYRLHDLSLAEWVEEYKSLRAEAARSNAR